MVERHLAERNITYEARDVAKNTADRDFVTQKGGKMQIPFLFDTERNESMYESSDIITYIDEHYGNETH